MSHLTVDQLHERLEPIKSALGADGYELQLAGPDAGRVTARIVATADACPDCLVPKTVMTALLTRAIGADDAAAVELDVVYPSET